MTAYKGGVEGDVKYTKLNFLACFLLRQKEKNIPMAALKEVVSALESWGNKIADTHIIHGVGRSPIEIFKSEEEKTLRPLPKNRWEPTSWSQSVVRKDWRVMFDSAYYSVPYELIGKTVQICATTSLVRIFYDHREVAYHDRATKKWEYKRKAEYAPLLKEEVLKCTREGLLSLAEKVGPCTYQVAQAIFSHPTIDKLRTVRLFLRLGDKYSQERLESACQRACSYKMFSYANIKNILVNNLDSEATKKASVDKIIPLPKYRFERDLAPYKSKETFEEKIERANPASKHGNAIMGTYQSLLADNIMDEMLHERNQETN
jgi:hypothetical protein